MKKLRTICIIAILAFICTATFISNANNDVDIIGKILIDISDMTELNLELVRFLYDYESYNYTYSNDNNIHSIYFDTYVGSIGNGENKSGILPNDLYRMYYEIATLIKQQKYKDRGGLNSYLESLRQDIRESLYLCEAIAIYYKCSDYNIIRAYEMYLLEYEENLGESLIKNGVTNEKARSIIERILLNIKDIGNIEDIHEKYYIPYELYYESKENMMMSAFSLIGKVRYTWAGGHQGASALRGINPVWKEWEQLYRNSDIGVSSCIKPSSSWCPLHGFNEDERCINEDLIDSYNNYLELRSDTLQIEEFKKDKYKAEFIYNNDGVEYGTAHRFDGLDCSGYTSWIINQITNKYNIDSSAMYFTRQGGIEPLELGSDMQPGDVFAWNAHIVFVVGKVNDDSKVYVTIEQTPNVLKFGTIYYMGYKEKDLIKGMQIAREANLLLGNVIEEPHSYCMDEVGYYSIEIEEGGNTDSLIGEILSIGKIDATNNESTSEDNAEDAGEGDTEGEEKQVTENTEDSNDPSEESIKQENNNIDESPSNTNVVTVNLKYREIGRFTDKFLDDNIELINNKTLNEANAVEIIEYIITKLPMQYISGYKQYEGELFNKYKASTNIGVTLY